MEEENRIRDNAKKTLRECIASELRIKRGQFKGIITYYCEQKYKGHLWGEYAEYLSGIGDHEKAKNIYKNELKNHEGVEREIKFIVKADSSKENELISFYEEEKMWEKLADFYNETKRHDKAAEITKKYLENRPKEVELLIFHARELCRKGDHLRSMKIYRELGKYAEEAKEWNCLGKPGTAIEILVDYEHINEEACRKEEANYWKQIGWLHNAADVIKKFDNLAAMGLRRLETNKEREIDAIVSKKLEERLKGESLMEEKSKQLMIMQSNKDDIRERLKVYMGMEKVWIAKIAECYYRLGERNKAGRILEEIGLSINHLKDYTKKHREFGKENIPIIITKNPYDV